MNCPKCGYQVKTEMKFCKKCGNNLVKINQEDLNHMAHFILAENEVKVKEYHCTTAVNAKGEGYITVTNKRVLYHSYGETSRMLSEVHLEKVTGISTYYGTGWNIKQIIIGIVIVLVGIWSMFELETLIHPVSLILVGIGAAVIWNSKQLIYHFGVSAEGGGISPVSFGFMSNKDDLTGQGAKTSKEGSPTAQTHELMKELGAIILDFKNLGDHALEKWVTIKNEEERVNEETRSFRENDENIFG